MSRKHADIIAAADEALAALDVIDAFSASWLRGALDALFDEDGDVLDRGEIEEPIDPIAYERGLSAGRYP